MKENRATTNHIAHKIYRRAGVREWRTRPFILRPGFVWIGQSVCMN